MVIEQVSGWRRADRILHSYTQQLLNHRPVQYVLEEAWFAGLPFWVDENVLIPRPETEELVGWIIKEITDQRGVHNTTSGPLPVPANHPQSNQFAGLHVLDVGTGSGCIPVVLKKKFPGITMTALDINAGALEVAAKNAARQQVVINFLLCDFLQEEKWKDFPVFDIIVSNPPYVTHTESISMNRNVLDFEPHSALFVPDEDPLLFYRKLALFSNQHLSTTGHLFAEINGNMGKEVTVLFNNEGFHVDIKKDMQGKNRMLRAFK
jgi:release factor glutamine methyltransferase